MKHIRLMELAGLVREDGENLPKPSNQAILAAKYLISQFDKTFWTEYGTSVFEIEGLDDYGNINVVINSLMEEDSSESDVDKKIRVASLIQDLVKKGSVNTGDWLGSAKLSAAFSEVRKIEANTDKIIKKIMDNENEDISRGKLNTVFKVIIKFMNMLKTVPK